ncbi:MAG: DUF2339 domain-containing protein [Sandaracinus sp.]
MSLGFAVCASPFVFIAFLITSLRKGEDKEARTRLDTVESQLEWVRTEGAKLGKRIVWLEKREAELTRALEDARAQGFAAARPPEGVTTAHAAVQQGEATSVAATQAPQEGLVRDASAMAASEPAGAPADAASSEPAATDTRTDETAIAARAAEVAPTYETTTAIEAGAATAPETSAVTSTVTSAATSAAAATTPAAAALGSTEPPALPPPPPAAGGSSPPPATDEGWERWIGVRGAAALGASVLVIAALYFFQYSIEHGWIGPFARVLIGVTAGLACVVGSEPLRRRYDGATAGGAPIAATLANWLAGAGIAILYASSWAASGLYHLVPTLVSGIFMVAVTGACAVLAVYRDSLAIAVLGLFGGFLTPIALSTGEDRPISLFTYLFLLDGALLYLAQRKRWPSLAALALAFTALYQLAWIFGRMTEATTLIGLVITLAFAALFAGVTMLAPADDEGEEGEAASRTNLLVRVAAVLLPFLLAFAFAAQRGSAVGFGTTLFLVCVLSLGAVLVGVRDRLGWLAPAAASASSALLLVFLVRQHASESIVWQGTTLAIVPTLLFLVGDELAHRGVRVGRFDLSEASGLTLATLLASGSASVLVAAFGLDHVTGYLAWSATLALHSLVISRVAMRASWPLVLVVSALFHGGTWALWSLVWADRLEPVRLAVVPLLGVLHLALYQFLATREHAREDELLGDEHTVLVSRRTLHEAAAALGAALLLFTLPVADALRDIHFPLHAALTLVLGLFVLLPAMRSATRESPHLGLLALVSVVLVGLVQLAVEHSTAPLLHLETTRAMRFAASVIGLLVFTIVPTLSRRLASTRWPWRAAAIAPMLWFPALHHAWSWAFGTAWIGALPVMLALLTLSLVFFARTRNDDDPGVRTSALVWLSGATMLFVTVAIPLQLDREWITIGWALEATALLALYQRLDHPGLKWVAMLLFASVGSRLLLNPYVLGYYERSPIRVFNWLSYTYLVPAACLVVGGMLLSKLEAERLRGWERAFLPERLTKPFTGFAYALALVIGFAWLNLTIFDWYATGPALSIPTDRLPARDLTISISWALYGLFVLALGMWRESTAMRITSLLLILLTAGKVFLYDLSNLRDLYRVAALVGLAFSLITISLAYQRFVFRAAKKADLKIDPSQPPKERA